MSSPAPLPSAADEAEQRKNCTLYYERWRAIAGGIVETAGSTFLLLIAVKFFHASKTSKGLIASGTSMGLLLTPFVVYFVARMGMKTTRAAALLIGLGSLGFFAPVIFPHEAVFTAGSVIALLSATCYVPLLTQMYQDNYPVAERGRLFSTTVMIRIAAVIVFSWLFGQVLEGHIDRYRYLLIIFAGALLFASFCLLRCPAGPLKHQPAGPLHSLHWVRDDPVFRRTLISWMLLGFANLMMIPLRVEYMANPRYGLSLSPESIAILNGVIPNLARLGLSPIWGRVFDRMNFFWLRILLNMGFAIGILAFFTGDSLAGMVIGALVFGIANAGGDVAWSLWVTKLAPPERVAEYMSVHTFFTGIRGVLAPLVAFHSTDAVSLESLAIFSAALIVFASLLLVPEARAARKATVSAPAPLTPPEIEIE